MNIHKAKGLQAPIVVLAAPVGETKREPDRHIARLDDGRAAGYLVVQTRDRWDTKIHAMPPDWFERKAEEVRFEEAEDVRLMYVAATRAEDELVVARRDEQAGRSPWALLDAWLSDHGVSLDPMVAEPPPPRAALEEDSRSIRDRAAGVRVRRDKKARPRYLFQSVTSVTKKTGPGEAQLALDLKGLEGEPVGTEPGEGPRDGVGSRTSEGGPAPSDADKRSRGFSWGTVVHGALASAAGGLSEEELEGVCHGLLLQNERPLDAAGEPTELAELVALVHTVHASSLWKRARAAERTLVEVPFSTRVPELEDTDKSGRAETSRYIEGVIDLAFREADGWTIADYKTDVGTDPDFPARAEAYRRQVELYAACWSRLTDEPVKERIIFYTTQPRREAW